VDHPPRPGLISVVDVTAQRVVTTITVPAGPPRFVSFCDSRAWVSVYSVQPDGRPDDAAPPAIAVLDTATLASSPQPKPS
jgi:hypothetical protein